MLYIAFGFAFYVILMLSVASFSVTAGIVLLAVGLVFGGAAAAAIAG